VLAIGGARDTEKSQFLSAWSPLTVVSKVMLKGGRRFRLLLRWLLSGDVMEMVGVGYAKPAKFPTAISKALKTRRKNFLQSSPRRFSDPFSRRPGVKQLRAWCS